MGFFAIFPPNVGVLAGARFLRWVAQSRELLRRLLFRYSDSETDTGNYLNELDEVRKNLKNLKKSRKKSWRSWKKVGKIFFPDLKNTFFGRFRAHDEFFFVFFLPMTPQSSNKWVAKRCNNLWRIDEFTFTETRIVCYSVLLKNVFEIYYCSSKFDREQFNGVSSTDFQHKLIVYRY